MLERSDKQFKSCKSIKDAVIPKTAGYDVHYLIPEGEEKQSLELMKQVKEFIVDEIKKHSDIYLTEEFESAKPIGPWPKGMWELQISPMDKKDEADSNAFDPIKNKKLHLFMLRVADFTKDKIVKLGLNGSLLIHANIWPANSNMEFEFNLHDFDHAWLVYGKPFELKNIWKAYIAIEAVVKSIFAGKGADWKNSDEQREEVIKQMQTLFSNDVNHAGETQDAREKEIARKTRNVLNGQWNLLLMQKKSTSDYRLVG